MHDKGADKGNEAVEEGLSPLRLEMAIQKIAVLEYIGYLFIRLILKY